VTPDISAYMSDASGGAREKAPLCESFEDYLKYFALGGDTQFF
jgi:hypothetical protein